MPPAPQQQQQNGEASPTCEDSHQQHYPYNIPFRDWKQAQSEIQSSLREQPQQPFRTSHTIDARDVIRRKKDHEIPSSVALTSHPQSNSNEKRQRVICIIIWVVIAILATIAAILVPLFLARHRFLLFASTSAAQEGQQNPYGADSSTTTSSWNNNNRYDDIRDPQYDLLRPTVPTPPIVPPVPTPTFFPTLAWNTLRPTRSPTEEARIPVEVVTAPPKDEYTAILADIRSFVTVTNDLHFQDENSPYFKALTFVTRLDTLQTHKEDGATFRQRYAMALLDAAVQGSFANPILHECDWTGVTCTKNTIVTAIQWPNYRLAGHLPHDLGLLSDLTSLDLAENQLWGTIPSSLFHGPSSSLEYLYLHQNHLSGTLSSEIRHLSQLRRLYLGGNYFSGSLPSELGSVGGVRPLGTCHDFWSILEIPRSSPLLPEYLSLYENFFTGTIPSNLGLRRLSYLDLGRNQLTGTFPDDWIDGRHALHRLKLLYLDHNQFTGPLPSQLGTLGRGRLQVLSLNDNLFSGQLPGFYNYTSFLNILEVQNNPLLHSMDQQGICRQVVFNGGEMVMMRSDCDICLCNYYCVSPWCVQ